MDALSGKNSTGRRVSLLNDGPAPPPQLVRLPSITPSLQPHLGLFPQTAPDALPTQPGYFNNRPDHLQDPHHQQHQQQLSEPSALNARPKKNSYPCQWKQFGCNNDYFTTSGHAARHAKKHTGKKDAFCPECNKAFTRKDKHGAAPPHPPEPVATLPRAPTATSKKAKHQAKRPRPAPLQSTMPSLSSLSMVDPTLPVSPATASYMAPRYNPSSYGGLDALAIAASGEKRKFES
ncbi:hypothetical protein J3E73DRAFT_398034 [Bipolaris maydis]|nr:hypothetical protein J3E73DRAFT_398034 [Bipolaris maydis]